MNKNYWPLAHSHSSSPSTGGESKAEEEHLPVLLQEVIEELDIKESGIYIDATFGRGGHTKEILKRLNKKGQVFGIDKDLDAVKHAESIKDNRLKVKQGSSTILLDWMSELGLEGKVDGILLDLGVASPQLESAERGFSFLREGPLDMRMDMQKKLDAATWVNSASMQEITQVLKEYGEERYSRRIARAIVEEREITPITKTTQLAGIVAAANPKWEKKIHPATRVFQAIRIFINNELGDLQVTLERSIDVLRKGGRLLVISFHSLEDRIAKRFIKKHSTNSELPSYIPVKHKNEGVLLKEICKPIRASQREVGRNPRARSAVLRVAEKIA